MAFDSNEVINGRYGFLYDENGRQLTTAQEFEANIEFTKEQIPQAGQFMDSHKVMGGNGTGSLMYLKITSELQKKIAENPTQKYNYIGKLSDPTSRGEEAILFKRVSFDGVNLMSYTVGEIVEVPLDFTFEDFKYQSSID